jgi:hypothetical protein
MRNNKAFANPAWLFALQSIASFQLLIHSLYCSDIRHPYLRKFLVGVHTKAFQLAHWPEIAFVDRFFQYASLEFHPALNSAGS